MSIVDPSAPKPATAPKPAGATANPRPVSRPAGGTNGAPQASQLKRKASGGIDNNQVKIQRKESAVQPAQGENSARSSPNSGATKSTPLTPTSTVIYRGTAAPSSTRLASPVVKKPIATTSDSSAPPKVVVPPPRTTPAATGSPATSTAAPKKGYLALLQKAKEKDSTKPPALPGKQEPTKILSRKERLALKAEASAVAKGKKPVAGAPSRPTDSKVDTSKEKRKPVEVGYQGTARPTKKPVDVGYSGTARPANAPSASNRGGASAAKAKANPIKGRYDGYADWDDLDDVDDEEDYESDASSDMEGGLWDVEEEENLALKVAKKEDAEALAEEAALKRAKEERKRKLLAMSKVAAAKRKY